MPVDLPPAQSPAFVTMDHFDETSRVGAEFSYLFPKQDSDGSAMRVEAHGQYVDPGSGFGGYIQLPLSIITGTASDTAIGDLEVGALFIPKLATPNFSLVLRAGLTLPTAPSLNDSFTGLAGELANPNNLYDYVPKGTSLRLSASPIIRQGQFFARGDIGFDTNLSADHDVNVESAFHLNVGAGVDLGAAALMAELVNVKSLGDNGAWIDEAAISARLMQGAVQPYAALLIPLDDDINNIVSLSLTVGIEGRIQ
ncbi:MAG TPA: hypothetical protein VGC41_29515 [Kofleriaceae bacterium]